MRTISPTAKRRITQPKRPKSLALPRLHVHRTAGHSTHGMLLAGSACIPCRLGRTGLRRNKREGDGATPTGRYRLLRLLFRADRLSRPTTALNGRATGPDDGWCDDPASARYNQPIKLPYPARHEELQRSDGLYDLVVVIDHNMGPVRKMAGSAVFIHVAAADGTPTAGCVALPLDALRRVLCRVGRQTVLTIA